MFDDNSDDSFVVLGLDPGSKNFAYSKIRCTYIRRDKNVSLSIEVLETGICKYTVTGTKQAKSELVSFMSEIAYLVEDVKVPCQTIGIEQYQTRGFGNKLIEIINIMVGALLYHYGHMDVNIFAASSWKNRIKKIFDLDLEYKRITCTPHELDATYIAVYQAFKYIGIKPFNGYKEGMFTKIARAVEKASTTDKRNRRFKE
jgi:hypothetical protein